MAGPGLCIWLLLAACGRIDYAPVGSDGNDDTGSCREWSEFSAPVPMITDGDDDWWLGAVSPDELTVTVHPWTGSTLNDVYISERGSWAQPFSQPIALSEFNTDDAEFGTVFAAGGAVAYFASDRPGSVGDSDLWRAERSTASGPFDRFIHLPVVNSPATEGHPWISADGLRLYFNSNRGGGGAVWVATRGSDDVDFSTPEMVPGSDVGEVRAPTLTEDELELFFATDAPEHVGEFDIWRATRASRDEPFGPPAPVVELSSPNDDVYPDVTRDGTALWFNYDTETSGGLDADVWRAIRTCLAR